MIVAFFDKGGPVMWLIALVCVVAVTLILIKFQQLIGVLLRYRRFKLEKETLFKYIREKKFEEALSLVQTTDPQDLMIKEGILLRSEGLNPVAYQTQLESVYDQEMLNLEKHLSTILILGEILPMLGLLGTVSGMIQVFKVIGVHGAGDASLLAGGISEALLTTQVGLLLGIPVMFIHNQLNTLVDKLSQRLRRIGARLVALVQVSG